jgi:hypothetical protein
MKWRISLVVSLCLALLAAGVSAVPGKDEVVGEGTRIYIHGGGHVYTISPDQPCWVRHGWTRSVNVPGTQPRVKELSGDQKAVIAGRCSFKLYINDVPVRLKTRVATPPGGHPEVWGYWHYFVQFPSNYFAPGTYVFRGVWDITNPNSIKPSGLPHEYLATLIVSEP